MFKLVFKHPQVLYTQGSLNHSFKEYKRITIGEGGQVLHRNTFWKKISRNFVKHHLARKKLKHLWNHLPVVYTQVCSNHYFGRRVGHSWRGQDDFKKEWIKRHFSKTIEKKRYRLGSLRDILFNSQSQKRVLNLLDIL